MHQHLGLPGRNTTFKSSELLGQKISTNPSSILPCEDCELSKSRLQDLIKSTSSHASNPGERIYVDTSWVNCNSYGGNKYWFLLFDDQSVMIWSRFAKKNSDLKDEVIPVIKNIQSRHPISFILCDNEGDNQEMDQDLDPLIIPLTFEYKTRDTTQHNGVFGRKYQTLYQQMRSILNGEGIYGQLRERLWVECKKMSTILKQIFSNKKIHSGKTPPSQSP